MNILNLRKKQAEVICDKLDPEKITAKDAMVKAVIFYEDDGIETIVKKLKKEDTNLAIVVDKDGYFLGEISIENLIRIIAHTSLKEPLVEFLDVGYHRGINFTTAKDHLIKHNNLVKLDTSIIDILKLIDEKGYSYIPVLDGDDKIKGLITQSSLLDLLSKN